MRNLLSPLVILVLLLARISLGQDCVLTVPANPLTATGLATPYTVTSSDATMPCDQADVGTFVQGGILDLATGKVYVYNPLVIDKGTTAAVAPVVPTLPAAYVAALWFGTNGGTLTLADTSGSLAAGQCVNGLGTDIFGQVAYCNAPAFFASMNFLVSQGLITIPPLTTAADGQVCPTTHSFFLVDQDQSDNVVTSYLLTPAGKLAQNTAANRKKFPGSTVLTNGSDERLLTLVNAGLGCPDYNVTDLADPGHSLPSIQMNEIMAAYRQQKPIAYVPQTDPMVMLASGDTSLEKINAYRIGMGQPLLAALADSDPKTYCTNIANGFPTRMNNAKTKALLVKQPSPDPAMATNLALFLAQRFIAAFMLLDCPTLLGTPVCVTVTVANGVALDMEINTALIPAAVDGSFGLQLLPNWAFTALVSFVVLWVARLL